MKDETIYVPANPRRKVVDYVLLGSQDADDLEKQVVCKLEAGYKLYGNPYIRQFTNDMRELDSVFMQAMIKYS